MADKTTPGFRIWTMSDTHLIDELSRPVDPSDPDSYLVLRVAVGRILKLLIELDVPRRTRVSS